MLKVNAMTTIFGLQLCFLCHSVALMSAKINLYYSISLFYCICVCFSIELKPCLVKLLDF